MTGGWMVAGMATLTGMPSKSFGNANLTEEQIWAQLSDWENKNYIMTTAVGASTLGLVGNHAYTVLGVAEYNGVKLVRCRNPWGVERYTGPWNDADPVWTPEAKTALNHTTSNDGIFFVPLSDFKAAFGSVVGTYYDDWQHQVKEGSWDRSTDKSTVKFTINNPVNQRAMIAMAGPQDRVFQDNACVTPERLDNLAFSVRNSSGTYIRDSFNNLDYQWLTKWDGKGAFYFDNLPAGTYTVAFRYGSSTNTGSMPFAVETFGLAQAMTIA